MSLQTYHLALTEHAVFKRFNERWVADPIFRRSLSDDKAATLDRYGIACRPEDVQSLQEANTSNPSTAMRAMWQIVVAKTIWTEQFYKKEGLPIDPRIRSWRERHIARQFLELGPFHTKSNIHSSLSIELTKGCSVGCWFCALSPDRLTDSFHYDDEGRETWRQTVRVLKESLGPAVKTGFLYWASDPLDHPNYEEMCVDFQEITGVFPPTTTALALKSPAKTRSLLKTAHERDCWINRFSILSLKMLDRIHSEFTAKELAHVECVALNPESAFSYGNAGRFRDKAKEDPEIMQRQRKNLLWAPWYTGDPAYAGTEDYPLASIGCVTGFLINMCDRTVQLISPCAANDRWPLGYYVHDQGTFVDTDELSSLIRRMIDQRMSPFVRESDWLRFWDFLRYEELESGFRLHGRFHQQATFEGKERAAEWRAIGALVRVGSKTVKEVSETVAGQSGISAGVVHGMLNELLRAGVIDEISN